MLVLSSSEKPKGIYHDRPSVLPLALLNGWKSWHRINFGHKLLFSRTTRVSAPALELEERPKSHMLQMNCGSWQPASFKSWEATAEMKLNHLRRRRSVYSSWSLAIPSSGVLDDWFTQSHIRVFANDSLIGAQPANSAKALKIEIRFRLTYS